MFSKKERKFRIKRSGNDGRNARQSGVLLWKGPKRTLVESKGGENKGLSWVSDLQINKELLVGRLLVGTWSRKQRKT